MHKLVPALQCKRCFSLVVMWCKCIQLLEGFHGELNLRTPKLEEPLWTLRCCVFIYILICDLWIIVAVTELFLLLPHKRSLYCQHGNTLTAFTLAASACVYMQFSQAARMHQDHRGQTARVWRQSMFRWDTTGESGEDWQRCQPDRLSAGYELKKQLNV